MARAEARARLAEIRGRLDRPAGGYATLTELLRALMREAGPGAPHDLVTVLGVAASLVEELLDEEPLLTAFGLVPDGLVRLARDLGLTYTELVALILGDAARIARRMGDGAGNPTDVDAAGVRRAWGAMIGRPLEPAWALGPGKAQAQVSRAGCRRLGPPHDGQHRQ